MLCVLMITQKENILWKGSSTRNQYGMSDKLHPRIQNEAVALVDVYTRVDWFILLVTFSSMRIPKVTSLSV